MWCRRLAPKVALVVALVVALGALVTAAEPAPTTVGASVPEVQTCTARPELGPGSSNDDVRCLQYLLILIGYPVGYTGVFDQATADAVVSFQNAHPPLTANGIAGEQTLRALGIRAAVIASQNGGQRDPNELELPSSSLTCLADAEQALGKSGHSVTCIQQRLATLGLFSGKVSGNFDQATAAAVSAFQAARPPLEVDGRAGPRTLAALGIWSGISPRGTVQVPTGAVDASGTFPGTVQDLPSWSLTPQGVPYYAGHVACTPHDAATIANEFAIDGADADTQQWAIYIASREGGCRADALNQNAATRDDSHCTFQLNVLSGAFEPYGELGRRGWTPENVMSSIQACADAASDLWVFCGRGPWTPPYSCRPPWGAVSTQAPPKVPTVTTVPASTTTSLPTDTEPPTIPVPTEPVTQPPTSPAPTAPNETAPPGP